MRLENRESWDEDFFADFTELRNRLNKNTPYFLRESIQSLKEMLAVDAPFNRENVWSAWVLYEDGDGANQRRPVGRVFTSYRRGHASEAPFVALGYFEAESGSIAAELFRLSEAWAVEHGFNEIRGPIQGNLFNGYRIRENSPQKNDKPFFREPIYPESYHDFFKTAGFEKSGRWTNYLIQGSVLSFKMADIRNRFSAAGQSQEFRVRPIDPQYWQSELSIVYGLIMDSYAHLEDFATLSLEEFRVWFTPFRVLVQKNRCLFLEKKGVPVAFAVALHDPLPLLLLRQKLLAWHFPLVLVNLCIGVLLKLNHGRLLILYIGKTRDLEGRHKGLIAIMAKEFFRRLLWWPKILLCYVSDGSPALRLLPGPAKQTAQYCLYRKAIAGRGKI